MRSLSVVLIVILCSIKFDSVFNSGEHNFLHHIMSNCDSWQCKACGTNVLASSECGWCLVQRAARRANAVAVKKLPENEELLNGEGELLKPSGEEYKEDTSFSGTDSTPGSDHEPNIYFTKFNQRGDLGEQESEELRLEMWRSEIFSHVPPPDDELYKYTEQLNIVGCGTNYVTHSKLACGDKGKKQFTDYFKDRKSHV